MIHAAREGRVRVGVDVGWTFVNAEQFCGCVCVKVGKLVNVDLRADAAHILFLCQVFGHTDGTVDSSVWYDSSWNGIKERNFKNVD